MNKVCCYYQYYQYDFLNTESKGIQLRYAQNSLRRIMETLRNHELALLQSTDQMKQECSYRVEQSTSLSDFKSLEIVQQSYLAG